MRAHARAVLSGCAGPLATERHLSAGQIQKVLKAFGSVVGGSMLATSPAPAPVPSSPPRLLVEDCGQTLHLFLAAVTQCMAVADALAAFAQVSSGHFSHDEKMLLPGESGPGPCGRLHPPFLHGAQRRAVRGVKASRT